VGAAAFPYVWIPRHVHAATEFNGVAKHLLYFRLSGGFRFTTAFNGDVADIFNPFGLGTGVADGTQWGVSRLLTDDSWLTADLSGLGLRGVGAIANQLAVLPCVDHEPLSGSADGNHQSGLERFLTGYAAGQNGCFTMLNYGLRARYEAALADENVLLPAIIMGEAGMGRGVGPLAPYRPPVLRGDDLDQFGISLDGVLPPWARALSEAYDGRYKRRQYQSLEPKVESYIQSRAATNAYAEIFSSEALKIGNNSDEVIDGISNRELAQVFGDDGTARNIRLALRLFKFGCPGVYMDQGGYDYHSDEDMNLAGRMLTVNRILSGLEYALKKMQHPEGGSYWDHTLVAFGSEFGRTAGGSRFNSAGGSDHGGDYATRWMSMPVMGGPVAKKGQVVGATAAAADLAPSNSNDVRSYRATMLTLFDALGCDFTPDPDAAAPPEIFPADEPFVDLWT
jgi:hypothetical protein